MPRRPMVRCPSPGCTTMTPKGRKCERCKANQQRALDLTRGNARARGYGGIGDDWDSARSFVLDRDKTCQCDGRWCDHWRGTCGAASDTIDHWPRSRKQLVAMGVQYPNDPAYLRGLCGACHMRATARNQPGGWNRVGYRPE